MIAGVDVGYGHTKAVVDGRAAMSIPSVVTLDRGGGALTQALGGRSLGHRVVIHTAGREETALVGPAALFAGGARSWDARAASRADYVTLVLTALRLAGAYGDVSLGVGLPLQLFTVAEERRALRGRLAGLEALVLVDGDSAPIRLAKVRVFPQSAAAYFAAVTDSPELARRPCAVVDVGYRTTDHVLLRLAQGETLARPDERASGSLDLGIERVYAEVAQALSREHATMIEPSAVEQAVLSGVPLTLWGREVDARPLVEDASRHLAEEVAARLKEAWGGALGQVGVVLVAGGGGQALYPHLARTLPAPRLMADPASANARGYAAMMAAAAE